jgi:argonaute-like protein implicated in RNA metabolism and viral defense
LNFQKIQIIKRRVDTRRLDGEYGDEGRYYNEIKHAIKRDIKQDTDLLFIDLIPKDPITNVCTLEILLHLQGEFTNQLIVPQHDIEINSDQINEIANFLNAKNVLYGV